MIFPALALALALLAAPVAAQETDLSGDPAKAAALVEEGAVSYRNAAYEQALEKFEAAIEEGASGGELFYQMGYCHKMARNDSAKAQIFMRQAIPFFEAQIGSTDRPGPYYYLAAIHLLELGEADRGRDVVAFGPQEADAGNFDGIEDGEGLFQIARLYSLGQRTDKALIWYERAVKRLDNENPPSTAYLGYAIDQLANTYRTQNRFEQAAVWYSRILADDDVADQKRFTASLVLVRAAMYEKALHGFAGLRNDQLKTESNYIRRVISRYLVLERPEPPVDVSKLDDPALVAAARDAAVKLSDVRQADKIVEDEAAKKAAEKAEAEAEYETVTLKSGQIIRFKKKTGASGTQPKTAPPPLPFSPQRLEAEAAFFSLMMEIVRRGHLLRELSMQQGFATLIFR